MGETFMDEKKQLWNIVLSELELSVSKANFKTWFSNTCILEIQEEGQMIVVGVPTNFAKDWLEKKYHHFILETLQKATDHRVKKVVYKVNSVRLETPSAPVSIGLSRSSSSLNNQKIEEKNGVGAYGLNPRYTFKNFIVGKGSELAYAACLAVTKQKIGGKYNPLFIYGGVGLGKTHLLQAIGHEFLEKDPKIKILYTNAEKFTNEFVQAIRKKTMDKFKNVYRGLDVLLIDDIQFMAGKEGIQEEFFHTFNSLYQEERQVVITSDRPPKEIPALEDRLTSRLEWGLIADISPPDLETRLAILKAKCQEHKYSLGDEILQYLAAHIQSNVRELEGALNKLVAYREFHQTDLDLTVAKNILDTLGSQKKRNFVQPKQLIEVVANFYGIKVGEMAGSSRKRELVTPRQVTMYLMREEIGASFPMIGKELGNRDHTTAMYAFEKVKQEIEKGGRIKQEIDLIKQRLYNQ